MAKITSGSGYLNQIETNRVLDITIKQTDESSVDRAIQNFRNENPQGIVGIIVNTVARAINMGTLLRSIFGDEQVTITHSRFTTPDRLFKDSEVLKIAGKDSTRNSFHIIVGTQVLEQSLDIDFDILFSDIAPVASMIQRMGRLHRHARPTRTIEPEFHIIQEAKKIPESVEQYSARLIYGEWMIQIAEQLFSTMNKVQLPNDIERLVEWLPDNYQNNVDYQIFLELNHSKKKGTRDFTLKSPPTSIRTMKIQSLHNAFVLPSTESNKSALVDAKVRDINSATVEVIVLFLDSEGLHYVTNYNGVEREKFYLSADEQISWKETVKILASTAKLPSQLARLDFITLLESEAKEAHNDIIRQWSGNKSLENELFIVFDADNRLRIANTELTYKVDKGLEIATI